MADGSAPSNIEEATRALDESVQAVFSRMDAALKSVMDDCDLLREKIPFLNGIENDTAQWKRELDATGAKIRAEGDKLSAIVTGKRRPEIKQTVNQGLADAAASDPDRKRPRGEM